MGQLRSLLALAFCVLGIYASYLTQGVVQETLSTKKFGPQGERCSHLSSLTAVQCWVCFLWAGLLLAVFGKRWVRGMSHCPAPAAAPPAPARRHRLRRLYCCPAAHLVPLLLIPASARHAPLLSPLPQ